MIMNSLHVLKRKTTIRKDLNFVFDFFSRAENLILLTPPELGFRIVKPIPIDMKKGTVIDYKIKINRILLSWRSEITRWEPPFLFEDVQTKGPYKIWIHEHKFEQKNGSTEMTDTVKYLSHGGIFEFILDKLFVKRKLESIFDYRQKIVYELFK